MRNKLAVVATAATLLSCNAQTYKITGTAEGADEGDTLFLTTDMTTATPIDTIIVKDGKFTAQGNADSTQLAMIYSAKRNEMNCAFFLEPGNIAIKLTAQPGGSRTGGTACNDQWQRLNDSVMAIGREINQIAEHIYGGNVTPDEQQKGMARIEQLNGRFAETVKRTATDNIDNEFGYFLLTYYPEEIIDNETRLSLIGKLPQQFRNRQAIRAMEEQLKKAAATAVGSKIPAFTQAAPDGTMINIMDEVRKNKVTVIDFWASWCGPCRQEMPTMVQMYADYKDKGLGIVGVSLDKSKEAWTAAIKQLGLTWTQVSDLQYWDNEAARLFSISSIPHTVVVGPDGTILRRGLRGEELVQFVAGQLGK